MKEKATKLQGLILDNRYKIISKIGVGGMADVFKGEDTLLGRPVAVKKYYIQTLPAMMIS